MKSIYCLKEWQDYLTDNVQNPTKRIILQITNDKFGFRELYQSLKIFKSLLRVPEPTKENIFDPKTRILVDIRDEFFRHFNCVPYKPIFRIIFNFLIIKHSFDCLYRDILDWIIGQMIARGWSFPNPNRPSSPLWDAITSDIKKEIEKSIREQHDRLMRQYKTEGEDRKEARYKAFQEHIIETFEKHIALWKE